MLNKTNQIGLHINTNQKIYTNIATRTAFGTNKMIISNIINANIIIIALSNTIPKGANTNRIIIVHGKAAPIRSDPYVTAIK